MKAVAGGADEATIAAASAKLLAASAGAWLWSVADQLLQRATVTRTRELYLASSSSVATACAGSGSSSSSSSSGAGTAAAGAASKHGSSSSAASASAASASPSASPLAGTDFEGESMFAPLLSLASLAAVHECAAAAREGIRMAADVDAAGQRAAAAARWAGVFTSLVPVAAAFAEPQAFAGAAAAAASSSSSSGSAADSALTGGAASGGVSNILFPLDAGLELADEAATVAAAAADRAAARPRPTPAASAAAGSLLASHRAAARQLSDRLALCAVLLRLHAEVAVAVAAARAWRPALGPAPQADVVARLLREQEQRCVLPAAAAAVRKRVNIIATELGAPRPPAAVLAAPSPDGGAAGTRAAAPPAPTLPSPARSRDFVHSLVDRLTTPAAEATVPRLHVVMATLERDAAAAAAAPGGGRGSASAAAAMDDDDEDENEDEDEGGEASRGAAASTSSPSPGERVSTATRGLVRLARRLPIALACAHSASRAAATLRTADDIARAAVANRVHSSAVGLLNKHAGGRARSSASAAAAAAGALSGSVAPAAAAASLSECDWVSVTAEAANEALKAWLLPALRDTANTHRRLVLDRVEHRADVIAAKAEAAAARAARRDRGSGGDGAASSGPLLGKRGRADDDGAAAGEGGGVQRPAVLRGPLLPGEAKLLALLRSQPFAIAAPTPAFAATVAAVVGGGGGAAGGAAGGGGRSLTSAAAEASAFAAGGSSRGAAAGGSSP